MDLERHEVVDLLPERSQESIVAWLRKHPGTEIATRDRSNVYREGLTKGAPGAMHVTDRWHLLHNLTLALEEFLLQKQPVLRRASGTDEPEKEVGAPGPMSPNRQRTHDAKIEEAARKRHERL